MVFRAEDDKLGIERLGDAHPLLNVELSWIEDLRIGSRRPIPVHKDGGTVVEKGAVLFCLINQLARGWNRVDQQRIRRNHDLLPASRPFASRYVTDRNNIGQ